MILSRSHVGSLSSSRHYACPATSLIAAGMAHSDPSSPTPDSMQTRLPSSLQGSACLNVLLLMLNLLSLGTSSLVHGLSRSSVPVFTPGVFRLVSSSSALNHVCAGSLLSSQGPTHLEILSFTVDCTLSGSFMILKSMG